MSVPYARLMSALDRVRGCLPVLREVREDLHAIRRDHPEATSDINVILDFIWEGREQLDHAITTIDEIAHANAPDRYPDPDGDRDFPGHTVCDSCNNDLELNADLRCTRCGAHA